MQWFCLAIAVGVVQWAHLGLYMYPGNNVINIVPEKYLSGSVLSLPTQGRQWQLIELPPLFILPCKPKKCSPACPKNQTSTYINFQLHNLLGTVETDDNPKRNFTNFFIIIIIINFLSIVIYIISLYTMFFLHCDSILKTLKKAGFQAGYSSNNTIVHEVRPGTCMCAGNQISKRCGNLEL